MPAPLRACLLSLSLAVSAAPSLHAQGAPPAAGEDATAAVSEAQLEDARKLFEDGLAHVEAGDWSRAEQSFRRVLALRSSPVVTYNLASALARLGRLIESAELLRAIVRDNTVDAATREPAQHLLAEIEPQIGSVTVRVLGDTERLVLKLDQRTLGASELVQAISVDPGVHVVAAERDGKSLASQQVKVGGAAPLKADVTLDLREPEPKPVAVDLRVSMLPGEEHGRERDEGSSAWASPWLWGGVAAVLATAAVITLVALSGGEARAADPVGGTTDPPVVRGRVPAGGAP